jgi:hypothetical protein
VSVAYWRVPAGLQYGCSKLSRAVQEICAGASPSGYPRRPEVTLRGLRAEPPHGAIYVPKGFARLAARALSGSLVLPR